MNRELPDVQTGFRKDRGTRDKNFQHQLNHQNSKSSRKIPTSALLTLPNTLTVWFTTTWKILKEKGIPDHLTCLSRNLYADQKSTVSTGHGTIDWFQIGKEEP